MSMDYVTGAKIDQVIELLTRIAEGIEYDLVKKYPEIAKPTDKK